MYPDICRNIPMCRLTIYKEISRGKLLSNYYHIIALVCIICGVGLLHSIDRLPLLVCVLLSGGIVFLCLYIKKHKRYQNI